MYEINIHVKFSSAWFAGLSIVSSTFSFLWSISECEIKFHTKRFGRKSTKIFAYENFFFHSSTLIPLLIRTVYMEKTLNTYWLNTTFIVSLMGCVGTDYCNRRNFRTRKNSILLDPRTFYFYFFCEGRRMTTVLTVRKDANDANHRCTPNIEKYK